MAESRTPPSITKGCTRSTHSGGCEVVRLLFVPGEPRRYLLKMNIEHWHYFLALDSDFATLSRYVTPASNNLNTYSLEIARMLMAATQECDVVLKQLCETFGETSASNEQAYRTFLSSKIPSFTGLKINLPQYNLDSNPFGSWNANQTPKWWTANNKVKHQRHTHFFDASLRNLIDAMSGLMLSVLYLYRHETETGRLHPTSVNFFPELRVEGGRLHKVPMWGLPS